MLNEQQTAEQMMQAKGRMVFLLMLTFFVVPIIVVIMMYKLNWKPEGASAGELVKPAKLLQIPATLASNNAAQTSPLFREKWSIVYLASDCEAACMQKLSDMRQLHVSLYKDIPRTQRVLLTNTQDTSEIKRLFPDLIVINQPDADVTNLMQQFSIDTQLPATSQHLYLVDPLGHLMMRYQPDVPLASVRKDVARLLRYSWAG